MEGDTVQLRRSTRIRKPPNTFDSVEIEKKGTRGKTVKTGMKRKQVAKKSIVAKDVTTNKRKTLMKVKQVAEPTSTANKLNLAEDVAVNTNKKKSLAKTREVGRPKLKPKVTRGANEAIAPEAAAKPKEVRTLKDAIAAVEKRNKLKATANKVKQPRRSQWIIVPTDRRNVKNVYQFKITLHDAWPLIWRQIQVPEDYSFLNLHLAVMNAMGWRGGHAHDFEMINPKTKAKETIGNDYMGMDFEIISESKAKIADYFTLSNNTAYYEYDHGDSWGHQILLEQILPAVANRDYPCCIDGKRACPPEDSGGVGGYENLLRVINDPKDPEHKEMKHWLKEYMDGKKFKPEEFKPKSVWFEDSALNRAFQTFGCLSRL